MENRKVNILGTGYEIRDESNLNKTQLDGLHEQYAKRIDIRPTEDMLTNDDNKNLKKLRYDEVVRHEIMHAFFVESGLEDYCANEQLVNWFAIQSPKIFKVFQELDIL